MANLQEEFEKANTNNIVKFYYNMLKELHDWSIDRLCRKLNKMTVLVLSNTAILVVVITFLLHSQLLFYFIGNCDFL